MSVVDFLFEGRPPPSVTSYGTSSTNVPAWLNDYTQGLIARANAIAAEPYQQYDAPRIAGFTPEQKRAFGLVGDQVGKYKPQLDQAGALTQTAGNTDIVGAAKPYIDQAGKRLPGNVSEYMNPYTDNVINRAEFLANRNFKENVMPGISGKFISGGQYGSSAHEREALRAGRELTEGLQSQSLGALSQAYDTAGQQFNTDQARQLQLGQLSGQLAQSNANTQLESGKQMGALSQLGQQLGIQDIGMLEAAGSEQQQQAQRNLDLAHSDFEAQRDYPRQSIDWLSSVIRGMPTPTVTNTTQTNPAREGQMGESGLSQLATLATAGKGIYDAFNEAEGGIIRRAGGGRAIRARRPGALTWVTT